MPTSLPRPRRVETKRTVIGVLFNSFMVMSALILAFIVLVREQGYANGQPGMFADAIVQMTQQVPPAQAGERAAHLQSN